MECIFAPVLGLNYVVQFGYQSGTEGEELYNWYEEDDEEPVTVFILPAACYNDDGDFQGYTRVRVTVLNSDGTSKLL